MTRFDRFRRFGAVRTSGVTRAGAVVVILAAVLGLFLYQTILTRTHAFAETLIAEADSAFTSVAKLTAAETGALRTYLNKKHVAKAKDLGVSGLTTREEAADFSDEGRLVPLESNAYFRVNPMEFSVPYVTPSMAALLTEIGVRFQALLAQEGLPPYRFVITSATRTREDQQALRQVNGNAASTSSHEFGTTVDLHYLDFDYAAAQDSLPTRSGISQSLLAERMATAYTNLGELHNERLQALLGRVLLGLQREGRVLAIYERRQPVYHITVARRVSTPAPAPPPTLGP